MRNLLIALALVSSPVAAQECKYDGSQLEMNACAKRDYYHADKDLNRAYYAKLKACLSAEEREALVKRQREWIKRRDARCRFVAGNGSNATIDSFTCLQSMTEIRTLQLLR